MRVLLAPFLACAALSSSACYHVTNKVPGVLDIRSDGSGSAIDSSPLPPDAARTGLDSFISGGGVVPGETAGAGQVRVEDRGFYLLSGFMPIINGSSTEELALASKNAALRDVHLGDQLAIMDIVWRIIPCVNVVTSSWLTPHTVTAAGTRVAISASPAESPVPPPTAPAAPASAPTTP